MFSLSENAPSIACGSIETRALDVTHSTRGKGGRPRLALEQRRSKTLHLRVTSAEAATVTEQAAQEEIPVPAFLRRTIFGRRIKATPPAASFAYAAGLARLAADLRRLERLALAGRIIGVPVEAIERLHVHLHALGLAALGIEGEVSCSPSLARGRPLAASSGTCSHLTIGPGEFAERPQC